MEQVQNPTEENSGSYDQSELVIGASTVCTMLIEGSCNQSELVTGASAVCSKLIKENSRPHDQCELVTGAPAVCPATTATSDGARVERPCQEETSQPQLKSKLVGLHH